MKKISTSDTFPQKERGQEIMEDTWQSQVHSNFEIQGTRHWDLSLSGR